MSGSTQCPHSDIGWHLSHVAFHDATIHYLEIKGVCNVCEAAVTFRGLPFGMTPAHPTMAVDGSEVTLPFMLGDEEPAGNVIGFVGSVAA
jgi:hypothetical protein